MDALLYKLNDVLEFASPGRTLGPVEGFLSRLEGYVLFLLARYGQGMGEIVEIGSYVGRSIHWLACGSKLTGQNTPKTGDTEIFEGPR